MRRRNDQSQYYQLFPEIRSNAKKFMEYLRMSVEIFDYILNKIERSIEKKWCNLHARRIHAEERLVITLRFLATGQSYGTLAFAFCTGLSTVSAIVIECMDAIWNIFQPIHMPCPTKEDFLRIAELFERKCHFPNCLGAIDGRHIRIQKPPHSGSLYYNYKKFFSMVLQAHVDADCRYVTIDICYYGSQSDASIFSYSKLKKAIDSKLLEVPEERELPSSTIKAPYFLIGDGAYPLTPILMKPFREGSLSEEERNFNKRLSRARVLAENTFARTTQKWRIFYTTINQKPNVVEKIIKCTCILQNIITDMQLGRSIPANTREIPITERVQFSSRNDTAGGQSLRRKLVEYFKHH